jgi:hypothetical protein
MKEAEISAFCHRLNIAYTSSRMTFSANMKHDDASRDRRTTLRNIPLSLDANDIPTGIHTAQGACFVGKAIIHFATHSGAPIYLVLFPFLESMSFGYNP